MEIKQTKYYWVVARTEVNGMALTAADKVVFTALHNFACTNDKVYPSMRYLAIICGLGLSTVRRSISRLEQAGLVDATNRANSSNEYRINVEMLTALGLSHEALITSQMEEVKVQRTACFSKARYGIVTWNKRLHAFIDAVLKHLPGNVTEWGVKAHETLPVVSEQVSHGEAGNFKQKPSESIRELHEPTGISGEYTSTKQINKTPEDWMDDSWINSIASNKNTPEKFAPNKDNW